MKDSNVIGMDIAKYKFDLCRTNSKGEILEEKTLGRQSVLKFFSNCSKVRIGIEACGGAHYWSRKLKGLGHEVEIIPIHYVRPFMINNKNDRRDAYALTRAMRESSTRQVRCLSVEAQVLKMLHRRRQMLVKERTALVNQIRGFMLECGIVVSGGREKVWHQVAQLIDQEQSPWPKHFIELLREGYEEFKRKHKQVEKYKLEIEKTVLRTDTGRRLLEVPGFGPLTVSAILIKLEDPMHYRNGRHFAASLGLVPCHEGSGGKVNIKGMSKRGDRYLRTLMIHGARAVLSRYKSREDGLGVWSRKLMSKAAMAKVCVALANKHARAAWHMMRYEEKYEMKQVFGMRKKK